MFLELNLLQWGKQLGIIVCNLQQDKEVPQRQFLKHKLLKVSHLHSQMQEDNKYQELDNLQGNKMLSQNLKQKIKAKIKCQNMIN